MQDLDVSRRLRRVTIVLAASLAAAVGTAGAGASGAAPGGAATDATVGVASDPPLSLFADLDLTAPGGIVEAVVYDGNEGVVGSSNTSTLSGFTAPAAPLTARTTYVVFDGQCGPAAPNGCASPVLIAGGSGDTLSFTGGAGVLSDGPDAFKGSDGCAWATDTCLWDTRTFDVSSQVASSDTSVDVEIASGSVGDGFDCINHEAQAFAVGPSAAFASAGYAADGVGLRNQGSGTISISGIPFGSVVEAAYLYWAILGDTDPGGAMKLNGDDVASEPVKTGLDPCWGNAASFAYRADVTSLVSGNGTYTVSDFPTGSTSGLPPWGNPTPKPMAEGASLLVFYEFPAEPCRVTGGGGILEQNTFGFNARSEGTVGNARGELEYHARDVSPDQNIKSTAITGVGCSGNQATIQGEARVNGVPGFTFTVIVTDAGEPGIGADTFEISVSNGYSASGTLSKGNIQIH